MTLIKYSLSSIKMKPKGIQYHNSRNTNFDLILIF